MAISVSPGIQPLQGQAPWGSGRYYFVPPISSSATSATLGNGTLRSIAADIPSNVTLVRIGAEITSAGDVGSKLRLGIYADDGTGRPGALVLDAGTIAGDSVAVQEIVISQALGAGHFHFCGVVQLVTVTQPTVRIHGVGAVLATDAFSVTPTAGSTQVGYSVLGIAGALPASYAPTGTAGSAPRIFVKVA